MPTWKKLALADSAQTFSGDQTFSGNIEILKSSPPRKGRRSQRQPGRKTSHRCRFL